LSASASERKSSESAEEQEQAAQEEREFEARERALDEEWDRIGCGDFDPRLTKAEEQRCDELAGFEP
jgi:hypothetical protein